MWFLDAMKILAVTSFLLVANLAGAQESTIQLKAGAGQEKILSYCSGCHSLDYIQMNSPFPNRKLWEAEVNKMINAFSAQIPKEEVGAIVDYLTAQYGSP
jgi:sulfite dehydrogenase (cytochrome) subunit B